MPTYQTTGIIIGRTNFGEADRIIRFIAPEKGKVSAVAKGVRKIKSRTAGHLEPFSETSLMLATGRNLDVVTSARLIWYPHQLAADYTALSLAFALTTAIDRLTEPGQSQAGLYDLLSEGLHALDAGADGPLPELWFKLRLLRILGYQPELMHCVICGRHESTTDYAFSPERGGIVCHADAGPLDQAIATPAIKFWRLLSGQRYATISHITGAASLAEATLTLCDTFYEHHLGRAFRPGQI